ncbi:MAG: FlgD immunoglobulin-like domain containing protein [Calditrichia bacterium]
MQFRFVLPLFIVFIVIAAFTNTTANSGNETGCNGAGCHQQSAGKIKVQALDNLKVQVEVLGAEPGQKVAGELLDVKGNIVDFVDAGKKNPFILSAPDKGQYIVNAGFFDRLPKWDSVVIDFSRTSMNFPGTSLARSRFELFSPHPNPFKKETVVKFSLTNRAEVELLIFDKAGKLVRNLANSRFKEGIHLIRWDGRDDYGRPTSPGTYFCEIKSGSNRVVRRMVLKP